MCLCFIIVGAAPAFAQSNDVLNRLQRIEKEVDTLNRAVYKGEPPPPISREANAATAAMETRLSQIENDLRSLTGKMEQQAFDQEQLQRQFELFQRDVQVRLDNAGNVASPQNAAPAPAQPLQPGPGLSPQDIQATPPGSIPPASATPPSPLQGAAPAPATAAGPPPGAPPMPTPIGTDPSVVVNTPELAAAQGSPEAAALYEKGFAEVKQGNYGMAEKTLATFLKNHPDHALAPNAMYWLGETFYVRKDYDKASRVFAEAYQKYSKGPKAADNLLKLGMALAGKGEKDSACIALKQLKKEYPNGPSPVLARGDQEMAALGCS